MLDEGIQEDTILVNADFINIKTQKYYIYAKKRATEFSKQKVKTVVLMIYCQTNIYIYIQIIHFIYIYIYDAICGNPAKVKKFKSGFFIIY